jgi:hypothetical protein
MAKLHAHMSSYFLVDVMSPSDFINDILNWNEESILKYAMYDCLVGGPDYAGDIT